mmetsp:Transcript_24181/g.55171  ORF Transcript_24181/g.55171 Transcript_24181/m.55171 type:complete len:242 (-) Transcript_24181:397-1122(-)
MNKLWKNAIPPTPTPDPNCFQQQVGYANVPSHFTTSPRQLPRIPIPGEFRCTWRESPDPVQRWQRPMLSVQKGPTRHCGTVQHCIRTSPIHLLEIQAATANRRRSCCKKKTWNATTETAAELLAGEVLASPPPQTLVTGRRLGEEKIRCGLPFAHEQLSAVGPPPMTLRLAARRAATQPGLPTTPTTPRPRRSGQGAERPLAPPAPVFGSRAASMWHKSYTLRSHAAMSVVRHLGADSRRK